MLAPVFQPGVALPAGALSVKPADPAVAEGLEAPAIRALFEAAAPFAEQLHMADAAMPRAAAAARARPPPPPRPPSPPPAVAVAERRPGPGRRVEVEPVAPARPVQADTQEIALVEGGLSPALAADVVAETVSHLLPFGTPRQLKRLVRQALARRIPVQGPRALGGAALVLAGAGGTGKTLTVARLAAAYAAGSDLDVVVLALRPRDGGAELAGLLAPGRHRRRGRRVRRRGEGPRRRDGRPRARARRHPGRLAGRRGGRQGARRRPAPPQGRRGPPLHPGDAERGRRQARRSPRSRR